MCAALLLLRTIGAIASLSVVQPNSVLTGQHSKIEKQSYCLIRDQDELTHHWRTHLGWPKKGDPPPRFEVSFSNQDVVALFHGADVESDSLRLSVVSCSGKRFVFYEQRRYVAADRVIESSPYAFLILPHSDEPVVVVEGIRGDFGKTSHWKVRAVLRSAPVPPDRQKPLPYYSTQKGTKWVYAYDGGELTHVVTAVEDKAADKLVTVEKEVNGKRTPLWTVSVSDKGLFQIAEGTEKLEVPLPLLILPAKRGDKWELDHTSGSAKLKGTVCVREVEQIEVPAGKYTAIRLDWDYTIDGDPQLRTFWYAPGVGMVKMKTRLNELCLKSFHPGNE